MKNINFLLAGVGGQGTILCSNILGAVGLQLGYEVKKAEVHGMAQRGGAVETHVRWGESVYSPLVSRENADYLLGFEMLEAARWQNYIGSHTTSIVNDYRINPPSVNMGKDAYPARDEIISILTNKGSQLVWVEATDMAYNLGNAAASGVVLLGSLSTFLDGSEDIWLKEIEEQVPSKFRELNINAFQEGRKAVNNK